MKKIREHTVRHYSLHNDKAYIDRLYFLSLLRNDGETHIMRRKTGELEKMAKQGIVVDVDY